MVRVVVGVGLLALVGWFLDIPRLLDSFSSIDPLLAVGLCLASGIDRVLMAYKWNLLLAARDIRIPMWQAVRVYVVGNLVGTVTPGGLGSDGYRVVALSSRHKAEIVLSSVFLERLIGLAVIGTLAAIMLPFSAHYFQADSTMVIGVVVGGALLAVVAVPLSLQTHFVEGIARRVPFLPRLKVAKYFRHLYRAYAESRLHVGTLVMFTVLTLVEVVFRVFLSFLAAWSLEVPVSFGFMFCMMPMVFILGRLPISIQGLGVQEGLFAYTMVLGGFAAEEGVAIVFLLRAAGWIAMALPAIVLMWLSPKPGPTVPPSKEEISRPHSPQDVKCLSRG